MLDPLMVMLTDTQLGSSRYRSWQHDRAAKREVWGQAEREVAQGDRLVAEIQDRRGWLRRLFGD